MLNAVIQCESRILSAHDNLWLYLYMHSCIAACMSMFFNVSQLRLCNLTEPGPRDNLI